MNHRQAPMGTRWVLRSAGLLTVALVMVALPAPASAATAPRDDGGASGTSSATTTTTAPSPLETGSVHLEVAVEPAAQTVPDGNTALFTASVTTRSPVTIRWQTSSTRTGPWTDIDTPGGTQFAPQTTTRIDGHLFRATATINQQSASSPPVILHVRPAAAPPSTITPPLASTCPSPTAKTPVEPGASCPGTTPTISTPPTATPPTTPRGPSSVTTAPANQAAGDSDTTTTTSRPPYGTVGIPVIQLGREQTATGHNFMPGTLVKVTLEPTGIDLGTYTVGPDGTVTIRFSTTRLAPGTHAVRWTSLQP